MRHRWIAAATFLAASSAALAQERQVPDLPPPNPPAIAAPGKAPADAPAPAEAKKSNAKADADAKKASASPGTTPDDSHGYREGNTVGQRRDPARDDPARRGNPPR